MARLALEVSGRNWHLLLCRLPRHGVSVEEKLKLRIVKRLIIFDWSILSDKTSLVLADAVNGSATFFPSPHFGSAAYDSYISPFHRFRME